MFRTINDSSGWKNVLSDLVSNNSQDYGKVNKSSGSSRKTTSWTSTPDLTTLSDSVTPQVEQFKGNPYKIYYFCYTNHVITHRIRF